MTAIMDKTTIKTLTTHYIDGAFVESHGRRHPGADSNTRASAANMAGTGLRPFLSPRPSLSDVLVGDENHEIRAMVDSFHFATE